MTLGRYAPPSEVFRESAGDLQAPVVTASVSPPPYDGRMTRELVAPLDTGSGPTVVSERLTGELGLVPCDYRQCVTYENEEPKLYPVCSLEVVVSGSFVDIVRAVVMPIRTHLVIGRDVLNRLRVTLDASQGLVELRASVVQSGP